MNYEQEVKKVYPNAYVYAVTASQDWRVFTNKEKIRSKLIGIGFYPSKAWQSAFENLKREGKL